MAEAQEDPRDPDADLEPLLEHIFGLPDADWPRALAEACERHPQAADRLRRRVGSLDRVGIGAAVAAAMPVAGQRLGRYQLLEQVGQGAMGVVHRARADGAEGDVALKLLRPELLASDVARARFLREAAAAARLDHPAVCRLVDYGTCEGVPFLALRFVSGATLTTRIGRARRAARLAELLGPRAAALDAPAALARIVGWFVALAEGLAAAHAQGLVHRDVKPDNVLVDDDGRAVLVDFGLVRDTTASALTRSGEPIGTPAYMAPEQVRGGDVDARTDGYGLAATLYECLTLQPPFGATAREALYRQILTAEVTPPHRRNADIPRALSLVVEQALRKDPADRYPSMVDFAADLQRWRRGEPVRARPLPPWRRALAGLRRRPRVSWSLGLGAVVLGAVALLGWQDAARRQAESVALAARSGALLARDSTLAVLVAREAHLRAPEAEPVRSNLLAALAQNLQVGEQAFGDLFAGLVRSPDGEVEVVLCNGVWRGDAAGWRQLATAAPGSTDDGRFSAGTWQLDGQGFLLAATNGRILRFDRDGQPLPVAATEFAGTWWSGQVLRPMPLATAMRDGGFAVGDKAGGVCVLAADGTQRACCRLDAHGAGILLVQALPDVDGFVAVDAAGRLVRWQAPWQTPEVLVASGAATIEACAAPRGGTMAWGGADGRVHVVKLDGAGRLLGAPRSCDAMVTAGDVGLLSLAPGGDRILVGTYDQQWALLDFTAEVPVAVLNPHTSVVRAAAFTADGSILLGDQAGRILVCDRRGRQRLVLAAHQDAVTWIDASQPGPFRSSGWDGRLRRWRRDAPGLPVLEASDLAVFRVQWLDADHLVSAGADGSLILHAIESGRRERLLVPGERPLRYGLAVDASGEWLASSTFGHGSGDHRLRLWRVDRLLGRLHDEHVVEERAGRYLHWLGRDLLVAAGGGLRSIDPQTRVVRQWQRGDGRAAHGVDITHLAAAPGGTLVVSTGLDGRASLWNRSGRWQRDLVDGDDPVWSAHFTPDGSRVLLGFGSGRLALFDLDGRAQLAFDGVRGAVAGARVSPDGRLVAAAASDGLHVWTIDGRLWLRLSLPGLQHAVEFDPAGARVAVASSDGTVRIWPLRADRIGELAAAVWRDFTPEEGRTWLGR